MATNFLKLLKPDANLAHNGFDLSQKHVFSSKPGNCTPVLCIETVPDDKHEIDLAAISRTRTMETAAFVRGKFRWDFFFVPYVQLWHPFEQFITQRDDKHSTRQLQHAVCPNVELAAVLQFLARQLCEHYNANTSEYFVTVHGVPMVYDAIRLLDMLGYGDYRWLIDEIDTSGGVIDSTIQQHIDDYKGKYVNIFRLAAYQHIFYDFYRNKYWDVDITGGSSASSSYLRYGRSYLEYFNFDDIRCASFSDSHVIDQQTADFNVSHATADLERFAGLLTMRYSQYKKDLFTASLPSQQFGAVSSVDVSQAGYLKFNPDGLSVNIPSGNDRFFPVDVPSYPNVTAINNTSSTTGLTGKWSLPSSFDVLQLRKAEMMQVWKQNALRAGNMTDDAFRAHYGVSPYYYADNNVNFLGSFESSLDVNTVEATASSNVGVNNKVGNIAANGISVSKGNKIRFNCRDFGVIMCIEHFVPDVEYRSIMIDKANRLYEEFDFFTPEFQNIGLDAVTNVDFDGTLHYVDANGILGFAPRYWQYKTALDKCHGEFSRDGSMQSWVAPRLGSLVVSANLGQRDLSSFYVRNDFLDKIFGIYSNDLQSTDTFVHNVFFDCKAIRPMSQLGLPQF